MHRAGRALLLQPEQCARTHVTLKKQQRNCVRGKPRDASSQLRGFGHEPQDMPCRRAGSSSPTGRGGSGKRWGANAAAAARLRATKAPTQQQHGCAARVTRVLQQIGLCCSEGSTDGRTLGECRALQQQQRLWQWQQWLLTNAAPPRPAQARPGGRPAAVYSVTLFEPKPARKNKHTRPSRTTKTGGVGHGGRGGGVRGVCAVAWGARPAIVPRGNPLGTRAPPRPGR